MRKVCIVFAICLAILTSCDKVDFGKVILGQPYTGLYQGKDCVVLVDQADEGNVKGRIYLDEGDTVAAPITFSSDVKKSGKGKLWANSHEKKISKVVIEDDKIQGDIDTYPFSISLYQETDLPFKAQYMEPCHEVYLEPGRVYAKSVEGFWSSYPDTTEIKFAKTYINRIPRLVSTKKLDLDMDLYYPNEPLKTDERRRPLLILVHGGAFYNGDKQSIGFPEMGHHFAERGYVVASINHRLGFKLLAADAERAGYRALQDAHAAVCYLIDKADEYGVDTTMLFAAGVSAGAINALNLAFMRDENRPETTKSNGVSKWLSSAISSGVQLINRGARLIGLNLDIDTDFLCKELGLDSDLGPIDAVNDSLSRPFLIKAVVNMWGAVHSLDILGNSPQTDILSFQGDSDRIVPYDYGYPFRNVFEPYRDSLLAYLPKLAQPIREWIAKGRPINEWAFNPIYGSSQIHKKAKSVGMHSELITVEGGGHSLHLADYKTLSPFFNDTIMPVMTRFLCEEIVGGKMVHLERNGSWVEASNTDNVDELHWQVEGGIVLNNQGEYKVKVLFFGDAPHHSVTAGGKYKNGVEFRELAP